MSIIKDELSAISEDENEIGNESEVYDRRKVIHASKNVLREGMNKDGFKNMMEIENYSIGNSVLDKNISSKGSFDNGGLNTLNTKVLPSSLLKEVPSRPLQSGLDQYLTVQTNEDR